MLAEALHVGEERNKRLPTAEVNAVVQRAIGHRSPPSTKGKKLKVLYVTQAQIAPPTFVFFVNDASLLHFSYQRYLENQLAKDVRLRWDAVEAHLQEQGRAVMAWQLLVAAVIGYLLGSIPGGYVMGRLTRGIDVRNYGSGKTGATNALRTLSLWAVLGVLVIDLGKSAAAVSIARALSDDAWAQALAGIGAVVGHVWPLWLGFRGGRGVSAAYGSLLAMNPLASLALLPVAVLIIVTTRYMSLMSVSMAPIAAVLFLALAVAGVLPYAYAGFAMIAAVLIVALHHDNIRRLLSGTERKIGQKELQRTGGP